MISTSAWAQDESVSPRNLYAYELKTKYLNKKVADVDKQILSNSPQKCSHVPL